VTARAYVLGRFDGEHDLLEAAARLRVIGFQDLDLHSPYPLEGADEALALTPSRIPAIAFAGAISGASLAYLVQWWCNAVDWPLNIGNRPAHATLSFVPITFEVAILFSALSIFFSLMATFRFPQPYHPLFEEDAFRTATVDGFWLSVAIADPSLETALVRRRMESLGASRVSLVEHAP
jgi:hypothetical protein